MKLKKIYTMMAGAAMMLAACSPDDYGFGGAQYSSDDLKCPDAYTVTIDGNYVTLESKLKGCTPLWVTPNGRSQAQKLTIGLPFAGDYEVSLGAETRAGVVREAFPDIFSMQWLFTGDGTMLINDSAPAQAQHPRPYQLPDDHPVMAAEAAPLSDRDLLVATYTTLVRLSDSFRDYQSRTESRIRELESLISQLLPNVSPNSNNKTN